MLIQLTFEMKEFIMAVLLITVMTMLYKKFMMRKMGLAEGILPVISLGLGFMMPLLMPLMMEVKSSTEVMWMAGPCSSWLWDALLRYFSKK